MNIGTIHVGRREEYAHVVHTGAERTGPEPTRFWGRWSLVLGVLTFTSGLFLLAMFASMGLGRGAAPWGPINDLLSAFGNLMLALLIPVISRHAVRGRGGWLALRLLSAASVVGAASSFLLVAGRLGFEASTAVSMVLILLQVAWMLWLNRRFAADPAVPRGISRFGTAFALALLTGLALAAGAGAFGWTTPTGLVFLVPGIALGGSAWIAWPLWFILLGRHMGRDAATGT